MDLELVKRRARRRGWFIALGLALGLPAAVGSWHLWTNRDRGPATTRTAAAAYHREDPAPGIIHLRVSGEGYALGVAEGTALKAEITEQANFLRNTILGSGLLGNLTRDWLLASAWKFDAQAAPRFRAELRGMADASGVPYADLLLINCFDDLQHLSGCSTIVATGGEAAPLLHGRNLDYGLPRLARTKVILDLETRGVRLRTFGFPGFIGVLTGMSSRGLGLSSHTSSSSRNAMGEPSGLLYRRILEDCGTLEDMRSALAGARRTIGNNLALSDGPRHQALGVEFDAVDLETRLPEEGRLIVTNHFWAKSLQIHQNGGWWSPSSGSQARVACLRRSIAPGAPVPAARIQEALAEEGPGKAWRTPANGGTVQSVVMEPLTGRAWLALGQTVPVTRGGWLDLPVAW